VTYFLYGGTLAFTWFLVLNLSLSLGVAAIARPLSGRLIASQPALRARVLLALRLLPAAVSILFVVGVFLPSFLELEPRDFDEAFGVTTTTFAAVSCVLLATALWRGASALRDAAKRSRRFVEHARPIALAGSPAPAFCLDAQTPAMTLVGVFRPKLLVTRPLLDLLTEEELHASVQHEIAHLGAWDNLKRLAMRATPDALSALGASRRLEHDWALAAEHVADAAAAHDPATGLALASALLKVARLTPPAPSVAGALASPLVGGDAIALRISRLMDGGGASRPSRVARTIGTGSAAALVAALVVGYRPLLASVHQISEVLVHILP
jgi:hypothetical protein